MAAQYPKDDPDRPSPGERRHSKLTQRQSGSTVASRRTPLCDLNRVRSSRASTGIRAGKTRRSIPSRLSLQEGGHTNIKRNTDEAGSSRLAPRFRKDLLTSRGHGQGWILPSHISLQEGLTNINRTRSRLAPPVGLQAGRTNIKRTRSRLDPPVGTSRLTSRSDFKQDIKIGKTEQDDKDEYSDAPSRLRVLRVNDRRGRVTSSRVL
jgi:hypothetical protein